MLPPGLRHVVADGRVQNRSTGIYYAVAEFILPRILAQGEIAVGGVFGITDNNGRLNSVVAFLGVIIWNKPGLNRVFAPCHYQVVQFLGLRSAEALRLAARAKFQSKPFAPNNVAEQAQIHGG